MFHNRTEDGLLFKTKRRKKGLTSVQEEERCRVVTVDEKVRLFDTVHKDPAGGHLGVHKTYVVLYVSCELVSRFSLRVNSV